MSRKTSSSAPSSSYRAATSTGSPASLRLRKFVPLTTRPWLTSRQGMIRLASMCGPGRLIDGVDACLPDFYSSDADPRGPVAGPRS